MFLRLERDSIGEMNIPEDAYYGVQSLRAKMNFNITGKKMHPELIKSLAKIKKAAAITNRNEGTLSEVISNSIINACDEIIEGKLHDQFIVDPIQGGAGTSANMNANEVIANRAIELLDGLKGDYTIVHPNDHVNMCQSTNDVYPTSGKITVLSLLPKLVFELRRLHTAFVIKSSEFENIIKMGRTQLQDAVPMTLGQTFNAYASVINRDITRLINISNELRTVNIGATAIGTSINATPYYVENITNVLNDVTDEKLIQATDLIDATQNLDGFVAVSSILKTYAVSISKIANDIRLLSSGPKTGLAEINLPSKQNGSSIMPGKVNPVIPEVVSQVAFNVIGNDMTITMAAEAGQLELNAFEPVLFYNLFESIETLTSATKTFIDNCILGISANPSRCKELVDSSVGIVTALCPHIGYAKSAELAKTSLKTNTPIRSLILEQNIMDEATLDIILDPKAMTTIHSLVHSL